MPHKDPEQRREYLRQYYQARRERAAAAQKQRYAANKEAILEQQRERYAKKRDEVLAKQAEYRAANREQLREAAKAARQADPERYRAYARARYRRQRINNGRGLLLNGAKRRAAIRGIEFTVTVDDITWPTHCPVLGCELSYSGGKRDNAASLDRRDNNKGYVPGNVYVISGRANRIKSDASLEELLKIAQYLQMM